MDVSTTSNVVALGVVALLVWDRLRRKNPLPLPPGPKPKPIIGNLLDIPAPTDKAWLTYHEWAQQYGDVVYVEALGQKMLILDSLEAVNDLMERRSAQYSDRPDSQIIKLMDFGWLLSMMPYGEKWRKARRMLHTHVHSGVVPRYEGTVERRVRQFVQGLMKEPDHVSERIRESFGGTIMKLLYGYDIKGKDDPYVGTAEAVLHWLNISAIPGRYLVDLISPLKYVPTWFPGARFQREAANCRTLHVKARNEPMEFVKKTIADGTAPPSIAQQMLDEMEPGDTETEQLIYDLTGIAYLAGMDTTVAAAVAFFLALVVYPEVQTKAQAEIDAVVGRDRLPTFEDMENLPYVRGVVNEALRWQPVVPLSVPHAANADNEYRGYFIPKGTIVMGNAWAILHDPEAYPDPERFNPERYLKTTSEGKVVYDDSVRDPRVACFGFGRRICPGRWLADQSLFMTVATCLATLNVTRAVDENGKPKIPVVDVTSGLLSHPGHFDYVIKPRSAKAEELIATSVSLSAP